MKILFNQKNKVFALRQYYPVANRMYCEYNAEIEKESRITYDFKKYDKHKLTIKKEVLAVLKHLECKSIAVCPPHTKERNNLQKLFSNTSFIRHTKVEQRKYKHNKPIENEQIESVKTYFENLQSPVLLIDDVCVSGETINFFENILIEKGFEVKKLVLGLHNKLDFETIDFFTQPIETETIFDVGDVVYLKSDLNFTNPLTTINICQREMDEGIRFVENIKEDEKLVTFTYFSNGVLMKNTLTDKAFVKIKNENDFHITQN